MSSKSLSIPRNGCDCSGPAISSIENKRWLLVGVMHNWCCCCLDLSSFCTFVRCTVLTFERSENSITLRCVSDLQNHFAVPNAIFFVRTPDSNRQPIQDFTRGQGQRTHEIMFTLTPETEGNFSCQNPTTNEYSEELLLAG